MRLGAGIARNREVQMSQSPHALSQVDPRIAELVAAEGRRQFDTVRLIPSENYVSAAVLEATGTVLTNKYSEGYAGKRYYEGQQVIDQVETVAIERARALFGVDHANVQPYSGSPANLAVYLAFCSPGDTILSMDLPSGGHLTHGSPVSATGKWFHPVHYGVGKQSGRIDLDQVRDLALAERPKLIFCGGTAIPRTIDFAAFGEIAREVGAVLVADIAHIAGLVAGGAHPSPVGHAGVISTTTHKTLRGPRGAMLILAFFFSATRFISGAFSAHLPGLLQGAGASEIAAIAAGALVGPAQVGARLVEFGLLRSFHPLLSARIAAVLHPIGAAFLVVFGPVAAPLFAIFHGAGNGMITIAKGTLPLAIFGPAGYGLRNGLLSVPTRVAESAAPLLFGLLIDRMGVNAVLVSAGLCLAAFASLLLLRVRPTPAAAAAASD